MVPFSALPGIWLAPFFSKKYMTDLIYLDLHVKSPTFLTYWYMRIYFAQGFFETACSLGIQWTDCDICITTSNKWVQKIKEQYVNRSKFRTIKYMIGSAFFFKGQVYELGRFRNTVLHIRTTITPQVTPSPPLPPPPPPTPPPLSHHTHIRESCWGSYFG